MSCETKYSRTGDVNGHQEINSIDLALIKSYLLGIISDFPKHIEM